jgi:hypothetical protein
MPSFNKRYIFEEILIKRITAADTESVGKAEKVQQIN